jgi:hypothetical protein
MRRFGFAGAEVFEVVELCGKGGRRISDGVLDCSACRGS